MTIEELKPLIEAARIAATHAYAPYSKFQVGSAILGTDGKIHSGCNVENASYGLSICGERNAIWGAIAQGCRTFSKIVIFTYTDHPTPPCGACRQVLNEFAPNMEIILANPNGIASRHNLSNLLPLAFGPEHFMA